MTAHSSQSRQARQAQATTPRATYRVQLHAGFTFDDAAHIVPYLARLGISHLYVSPILKARAGSTHGYDVIDHTQLNPELGGAEGFERLSETLRSHDMGLIVDIVPNHLGVMGDDNAWWLDVLENGPAAQAAEYFDIEWRPNRAALRDRLLVPVLGAAYGTSLESGDIRLVFEPARGEFHLRYHEHRFPIDPREYPRIFDGAAPPAVDDTVRADFDSLLSAFGRLPARSEEGVQARAERYRDKEVHKRRLVRLLEREPVMLEYIEEVVQRCNGTPGDPQSFDTLDALHEAQAYRLAFWRVAQDEINYRRFFDVNSLAALRMNDVRVFSDAHRLILELVAQGKIQGLRIDHSDGLYDPREYFQRLRAAVEEVRPGDEFFIVTEKILADDEVLPNDWPLAGTTGYEFGAEVTAWLVDGSSEAALTRTYQEFIGDDQSFEDIAYSSRQLIMRIALAPEVEALATQLDRIARLDRHTADFTRAALRDAIIEVVACFPVYRTYVTADGVTTEDRLTIERAVAAARRRSSLATERSVLEFVRRVLLISSDRPLSPLLRTAMVQFAMKFQQVTAPVTAKGVEDTALYRFNRLTCLNEVGTDPRRFSQSSQALHQKNAARAAQWPHTMLGTSTHDSKRSEDVRARIAVLSEMPQQWRDLATRWGELNQDRRTTFDSRTAPDSNDEYLMYQTMLGTWQPQADQEQWLARLKEYAVKAVREAKRNTSWVNPDEEYESGLQDFLQQSLAGPGGEAMLSELRRASAVVDFFGRWNSLAQVVLKLTAPGVPDIYQGCETQTYTLVDPDNRRPVDFAAAEAQLRMMEESVLDATTMSRDAATPDVKLWMTHRLLRLRRELPDVFAHGTYVPLAVEGELAEHVLAFARVHESQRVVVIVTRWFCRLMSGRMAPPTGAVWGATRVVLDQSADALTDILSDELMHGSGAMSELPLAQLLTRWPFAVLRN